MVNLCNVKSYIITGIRSSIVPHAISVQNTIILFFLCVSRQLSTLSEFCGKASLVERKREKKKQEVREKAMRDEGKNGEHFITSGLLWYRVQTYIFYGVCGIIKLSLLFTNMSKVSLALRRRRMQFACRIAIPKKKTNLSS